MIETNVSLVGLTYVSLTSTEAKNIRGGKGFKTEHT